MNQTFSLSRFGRLLRIYLSDNRGSLLINIVLLVGGLSVLALFFYRSMPVSIEHSRYLLLFFVGWAAWYVFTIQQVAMLNEKERAITYLLRPASLVEKYVLILLVSGISFLVVYLAVFTLVDAVGVSFVNHRNWTAEQLNQIRMMGGQLHVEPYYKSEGLSNTPITVWVFSMLLHPVVLTVALLIRRFPLALVAVIILGVIVIGLFGNEYLMSGLFAGEDINAGLPYSTPVVIHNNTGRQITLPEPTGNQLRYAVGILAVVLLYITVYFRIKEREV